MMDVAVHGVGTSTSFAKQQDRHPSEFIWQAVIEALDAAEASPSALDAVFVGTVFGAPGVAQRALHALGIVLPIERSWSVCE